ncbi:TMEM43 family protein [Legionella resiliens]|uniref:TMEM43 family protein n=1 Tax=Legionella resiliens TaxID=2905958 RepID=A0ABS8WZB1_9GAMM|nr:MULTISPECIES: TMEM43 family protein [unclassified Legionella]MCE0721750.1 TMEM43 family protein [Legionella sp. 9fVS26]MCE3530904.1 TMEM43 family protein [Legionella sp. 8cVS16]
MAEEEITTTSWFSRLKDAFLGIFIGIALIIGAIVLVFWNEGHSLHMAQSLEQTKSVLISVPNTPINKQNNLKVVYLSGLATTKDTLVDALLGVSINAINLHRKVEMYQWKQKTETRTESQLGGSEKHVTTYTYDKVWSESSIDSSNFKNPTGHQNPTMPIQSQTNYAKTVTVGDFLLPEALIKQIDVSKPVSLTKVNKETLKNKLNKPVTLRNNELYLGQDYQNPQLGDLRITLSVIEPQTVSIIAQQTGETFQPYFAPAGQSIMLLSTGQHSSDEMIAQAQSENTLLAWVLRVFSLLLLIGGFSLILKPLVILADVIPFLGTIVGFGTGFIALLLGLCVWLIVTAIAWFATRPLLSISLLIIAVVGGYLLIQLKSKKTKDSLPETGRN